MSGVIDIYCPGLRSSGADQKGRVNEVSYMNCAFCGNEVPDNARFCLSCGKEIMRPGSSDTIFVTQDAIEETKAPEKDAGESRPDDRLFSKVQRRLLVIVGIIAGLALITAGITWGIVSMRNQLAENRANELKEERLLAEDTSTQTQGATVSESVIQSETVATETTLSAQEINAAILDDYYTGTLVPLYGEADMSLFSLVSERDGGAVDLQEFMPDNRKGIVNSLKEDLDGDGVEELMVVISRTFANPLIYTQSNSSHIVEFHYDGIEIKLFQVVGGTVQEMISDNRAMIFDSVFMNPSETAMQICILENGGEKYIYIMMYFLHSNDSGTDVFRHEFYDVTETGIHCVSGTRTEDGIIYDELDLSSGELVGTETFSIWSGDVLEDYYGAIQARLEPFGLDCSWLDSYYAEIVSGSTISDITYSHGLNNSKTPLSDLIDNIRVITIVVGTNDGDFQTFDIS
jgi:hypothetical protein